MNVIPDLRHIWNVISKYCACHEILKLKISAETPWMLPPIERRFDDNPNTSDDIRRYPTTKSSSRTRRFGDLTRPSLETILYCKIQHFASLLSPKMSRSAAPVTESHPATSANTAPATQNKCRRNYDFTDLLLYGTMTLPIYYFAELLLYWSITLRNCYFTDLLLYGSITLRIYYFANLSLYETITLRIYYFADLLLYESITLRIYYLTDLLLYETITLRIYYLTDLFLYGSFTLRIYYFTNLTWLICFFEHF